MVKNELETFDRLWLLCDLYIYLFQLDILALYCTERQSPAPLAKFSWSRGTNSSSAEKTPKLFVYLASFFVGFFFVSFFF